MAWSRGLVSVSRGLVSVSRGLVSVSRGLVSVSRGLVSVSRGLVCGESALQPSAIDSDLPCKKGLKHNSASIRTVTHGA